MKGVSKEFLNKLILVTIAAILIWNFEKALSIFDVVKNAFRPIFIGIIIALILNVPMQFFEKKVFYKFKKLKTVFSLWSSVILFVGAIVGFGFLFFPRLVESIKHVAESFQSGNAFENLSSDNPFFNYIFDNLKKITEDFIDRLQEYLPKMLELAGNVLRVAINIFLGLFLAILMLMNKEELKRQFKKLLFNTDKKEKAKDIMEMFHLALDKFSKYVGGMLLEAMILGIVCYLAMLIIGLPFAPVIAAVIALVNLIPMVGAYIGGGLSALLIFSVNPGQALIFIIFIVILQQLESVTTYPVIVGRYVGLSSFWILVSVILGGSLFGFTGVFLAVPVMAFLHDFIGGLLSKKKTKTTLYLDGA